MNFLFLKGTWEDTERYIQFLDEIKAGMPQKDWFYLDPADVVRSMMSDGTMEFWMAFHEEKLAAIFSILFPGLGLYNYGYDLGLSKDALLRVIHMDTAAVHPDYRGFALQKRMAGIIEQELSGKGERILLSTVHPENRFSLNNMLQQGYRIQKRVGKYGSERLILRKNIF